MRRQPFAQAGDGVRGRHVGQRQQREVEAGLVQPPPQVLDDDVVLAGDLGEDHPRRDRPGRQAGEVVPALGVGVAGRRGDEEVQVGAPGQVVPGPRRQVNQDRRFQQRRRLGQGAGVDHLGLDGGGSDRPHRTEFGTGERVDQRRLADPSEPGKGDGGRSRRPVEPGQRVRLQPVDGVAGEASLGAVAHRHRAEGGDQVGDAPAQVWRGAHRLIRPHHRPADPRTQL